MQQLCSQRRRVSTSRFFTCAIACVQGNALWPLSSMSHCRRCVHTRARQTLKAAEPKPNIPSSPAVRRACRSSGERCHRSLRAPFTNIERSAYLRPRKPFMPQRRHPGSVNLGPGPSELLSFGVRIAQPGAYSLPDEVAFKLCHNWGKVWLCPDAHRCSLFCAHLPPR